VEWQAFKHEGITYDLSHLNPCSMQFERAAKDNLPATIFNVDVTYSLHCFAREIPESGGYDNRLEYSDARETRLFDARRYEFSKLLPEIVRSLASRKCRHTDHSNFFTVECIAEGGRKIEYDIFFTVSKSGKKGRLNLFIQSAYIRDDPKSRPPSPKPIGFLVILHNILNRKPIRA
jgi:hypothetical protein